MDRIYTHNVNAWGRTTRACISLMLSIPEVYVRLLDTRNDARVAVRHTIMQVNDYGCHWKNLVRKHRSRIHTFFAHATHPKYLQRPPLEHVSKSLLVLTGVVSDNGLKKKCPKTQRNFKHQREYTIYKTHAYIIREEHISNFVLHSTDPSWNKSFL